MAKPFYKNLTVQVLTAIAIGVVIALVSPKTGMALKPLGDGFIRLVKMVVTPIIFLTVVVGIASIGNLRKAGRVGLKAIVYFEGVTTVALAIGLLVAIPFAYVSYQLVERPFLRWRHNSRPRAEAAPAIAVEPGL